MGVWCFYDQVFHVGQLHSLHTLSLAHNFITDISLGGLASCDRLTDLDVSNNLLQVRCTPSACISVHSPLRSVLARRVVQSGVRVTVSRTKVQRRVSRVSQCSTTRTHFAYDCTVMFTAPRCSLCEGYITLRMAVTVT